ncbi:SagB/ThcOx family dehydrogenase [Rhodoblastus acidophilus]|uniref:SagB/ThcOx family dehydrogenase n=1 Tax=Candidatus Rhodoblastus alkanivorans TaxID=2954117 RepID=A0ABS9Z9V7_9HYPH|nr:SagB/ThcOx family dehydrogenase [Candidatus Rhodoblastus alkanivorans]MCI4677122.1 SagB/ThcOx family dehydrogenase [Candidatus Rhodoblastus alkanivorans]MCI4684475.1 SagB/ThcOx family dehydrogenase [Candidatus Rhodoblastus alkanivorans]MDI4641796.1 SagB/ThcOx family dehydrogenase [Rhodoblastus acidophilus]
MMSNKALLYHERTKHRFAGYAKGPDTLDWEMQPNPFRTFDGAAQVELPLAPENIFAPALNVNSIGALLHLAMGLSAWKEFGPDRWALRCNPSSGNLHPTEAYVLAEGIAGLDDGLYHYVSRDHVLEQRRRDDSGQNSDNPRLWIGLSSIHWREAWKYGERAFRYCQLDLGHALGAFAYAAQALGWRARAIENLDSAFIAARLGLDRDEDFGRAEREDPDALLQICLEPDSAPATPKPKAGVWAGKANLLDRRPMYRWPVIDEVSQATLRSPLPTSEETARDSAAGGNIEASRPNSLPIARRETAGEGEKPWSGADLILQRRSAQHFDARHIMPAEDFFSILQSLLPQERAPWTVWDFPPAVHPILFVHRVGEVEPGLYALPRHSQALALLRQLLDPEFVWSRVAGAPDELPLFQLRAGDARGAARRLFCNQAIASDCCFGMAMLAEFDAVERDPWTYRRLHWEAGLIGQALYLEAEGFGLRGTGVGCFFDDETHAFLGMKSTQLQTIYHFTIGAPLNDTRIATEPAYPQKQRPKAFAP